MPKSKNKRKTKKSQSRKIHVSKHGRLNVTDGSMQKTVRRAWLGWPNFNTDDQRG